MDVALAGTSSHRVSQTALGQGALPRGGGSASAQGHMSVPTLVALGSLSLTKVLGYPAFLGTGL